MTGIFFGSTMGTTEAVAADIAKQLGVADADVHNVADTPAGEVQKYDLLVLGSSTWGAGELQDDWYGFLDQLKAQDLSGKKVALFGCGDSGSYPDTFCDAVGLIYDGLQQSGFYFSKTAKKRENRRYFVKPTRMPNSSKGICTMGHCDSNR